MKNVFLILLFFVAIVFVENVQAVEIQSNSINTGVPELSIAPDARATGMGDVGAATSPDVFSQYWNPSKYAFMESPMGVAFTYTPWLRKLGINDMYMAYICAYNKLDDRQAISTSLRYFSLGKIQSTTQSGFESGSMYPNEFAFDVAYSMQLSSKLSAAVSLRYINSDLLNGTNQTAGGSSNGRAITGAADVSLFYRTPVAMETGDGKLALGFCISNIGGKVSYDKGQTTNFIPTNLKIGGSYEIPIDTYNKISLNADVNKLLVPTDYSVYGDTTKLSNVSSIQGIFKSFELGPVGMQEKLSEIQWCGGAEYAYNNQFFVRAGYHHESQYKGNRKYMTFGAGFKLNIFQVDVSYVYANMPNSALDQTLRISLAFDLNGIKNLAD